ncbi:hypothetical protein QHF85_46280 [Polyangium sp. 6x1]|nr:hypothetical protein [Polyangium sp. 6x1]
MQPTLATERANPSTDDAQRRRMLDLERRVAAMEATAEAGAHPQAEAKVAPEDLEAEQHRNVEMHEQAVARHWEEPVDKAWSSTTAKLFEDDFDTLEQKEGLKLVSVDCRTRSCLATVEWKTFDEAQQGFDAILHHLYAANCTREILLPEPNDRTRPYQATAVFNCEAWRSAQR